MAINESVELDYAKERPPKLPGLTSENSNFSVEKDRKGMDKH